MNDLDRYLDFAKELAVEAGLIMKKYFQAQDIGLEIKADKTPLTLADTEVNSLVIKRVKERFPGHGVLGEEESFGLESDNLWIVDPIDGTFNFSRRIPLFAFCLALATKGELQAAAVYDPIMGRLLYASKGKGAYENGQKLDVSNKDFHGTVSISSWVVGGNQNSIFKDISVHGKFADAYARQGNIAEIEFPIAYAIAALGSSTLDGVVTGLTTPWDAATGSLIAMEAGAIVTDLYGNKIEYWHKNANGVLAAPPKTHKFLLETIQVALKDSR